MLMSVYTQYTVLMVGFNQNSYSFDEDQATGKQACIVIEVGSIEGNLPLTFTVSFSDGTALGKQNT